MCSRGASQGGDKRAWNERIPTGGQTRLPGTGVNSAWIMNLHIATYNIHKGFSQFNRRMMIHELRERLRLLAADIIFLQEVQGHHIRNALRFEYWPAEPQY